jgi:hypothetical protein
MQAEWARAALLSAIILLDLPAPPNATAADRARVGTLIGYLKQVGTLIGYLKQVGTCNPEDCFPSSVKCAFNCDVYDY